MRELNSVFMQIVTFVSLNQYGRRSRDWKIFFPSQVENLLRKCMHLINLIGYAYYVRKVILSLSTSHLTSVRVRVSYTIPLSKTKQSLLY